MTCSASQTTGQAPLQTARASENKQESMCSDEEVIRWDEPTGTTVTSDAITESFFFFFCTTSQFHSFIMIICFLNQSASAQEIFFSPGSSPCPIHHRQNIIGVMKRKEYPEKSDTNRRPLLSTTRTLFHFVKRVSRRPPLTKLTWHLFSFGTNTCGHVF